MMIYKKKKFLKFISIAAVVAIFFSLSFYVGKRIKKHVSYPRDYQELIQEYAKQYNLDPGFVNAVIFVESGCRAEAVSPKGAVGLMQVMPTTAEWLAGMIDIEFDPQTLGNPRTNIEYGCCYLEFLSKRYDDQRTIAAAYNAGQGRVNGWIKQQDGSGRMIQEIPYEETRNYVKRIEEAYAVYAPQYPLKD